MSSNYSANQFEKTFDPKRLGNWEINTKPAIRPKPKHTTTNVIADENGHLLPGIPRRNVSPWIRFSQGIFHRVPKKRTNHDNNGTNQKNTSSSPTSKFQKINNHYLPDKGNVPAEDNKRTGSEKKNSKNLEIVNSSYHCNDIINRRMTADKNSSPRPLSHRKLSSESSLPIVCNATGGSNGKIQNQPPLLADAYCDAAIADKLKNEHENHHHALPDMIDNKLVSSQSAPKVEIPKITDENIPAPEDCLVDSAICFKGFGPPGPTRCTKLKVYRPKTTNDDDKKRANTAVDTTLRACSKRAATTKGRTKPLTEMDLAIYWDVTPENYLANNYCKPTAPAVFTTVRKNDVDDYQTQINDMDIPSSSVYCRTDTSSSSMSNEQNVTKTKRNNRQNDVLSPHPSAVVMNVINKKSSAAGDKPQIIVGAAEDAIPIEVKMEESKLHRQQSSAKSIVSMSSSRIGSAFLKSTSNTFVLITNRRRKRSCSDIEVLAEKLECNDRTPSAMLKVPSDNNGKKFELEKYDDGHRKARRYESVPNLANVEATVADNAEKIKGNSIKRKENNNNRISSRPCVACEAKKLTANKTPTCFNNNNNNDKHKMAFKAGKLNNFDWEAAVQKTNRLKMVRVPKPKIPFAKKSYSIATLMPPFSIWPTVTGQDYPDHWRLASVYQHSYKPIESRKSQLIKTVFL